MTEKQTTEERSGFPMPGGQSIARVNLTLRTCEIDAWLSACALRDGLLFTQFARWHTAKRLGDLDAGVFVAASVGSYEERAVLTVRNLLVKVTIGIHDDECSVVVYASRFAPGDMAAAIDQVRSWLDPKADESPETVRMTFRYHSCEEGNHERSIETPTWLSIEKNYPSAVCADLEKLFHGFDAGSGGRLILLHGLPGTGKTYVIRALAREWRAWCSTVYVVDPETFFGNAEYMMQTLIEDSSSEKWRLLIVEDAGELLSRDAKKHEGQGLSRLLNLTEGLIGQGLRVLILISTNEKLQALNEAVSRPGRTAAEIEFAAFSADEANAWLAARGRQDLKVNSSATLAELFAMLSGVRIATQTKREPLGFIRR
jgi:hypothetical protein